MNNSPYSYHTPAYDPNSNSFRESIQYQQAPSSKTIIHHEPIHVGSIPSQPIINLNPGHPGHDFGNNLDDNDTRQFIVGRGRWGRPGFRRPFYGGGFAAPFLLGSLAGAALTRPIYPYYPYPYYPYPYY